MYLEYEDIPAVWRSGVMTESLFISCTHCLYKPRDIQFRWFRVMEGGFLRNSRNIALSREIYFPNTTSMSYQEKQRPMFSLLGTHKGLDLITLLAVPLLAVRLLYSGLSSCNSFPTFGPGKTETFRFSINV